MEHKYAQVLRWIADGLKVQTQGSNGAWFDQTPENALLYIVEHLHADRFRLAPRTVKVGGVEIEASLSDASNGQIVYWVNQFGEVAGFKYLNMDSLHECLMKQGKIFATQEAARAAHDACVKLMTQGEA